MAKALVTPINIPNCTRFVCLDYDLENSGTTITKATVKLQLRQPAGGQTEDQQRKTAYKCYTLTVVDGICDCLTVAGAGENMFHNALTQSTKSAPTALTDLLTAVDAANKNNKHDAVITSLAASTLIPAVS